MSDSVILIISSLLLCTHCVHLMTGNKQLLHVCLTFVFTFSSIRYETRRDVKARFTDLLESMSDCTLLSAVCHSSRNRLILYLYLV